MRKETLTERPTEAPEAVSPRRARRRVRIAFFGVAVAALVTAVLAAPRVLLNVTDSLPRGFYVTSAIERPIRRGDVVELCLTGEVERFAVRRGYLDAGTCETGAAPLLKIVVGIAGDIVTVDARGVSVDGRYQPNSRPLRLDSHGRPMTGRRGRMRLAPGSIWVWTPNPRSFDSRYFGAVPVGNARRFVRLIGPSLPYEWASLVPEVRGGPAP